MKQTLLLLLLSFSTLFAQTKNEKRLTLQLNDARFAQFVKEAEAQTGHYFYYDASPLDSLKITLQATDQTLVSVLLQVFKGTEFKFSIDDRQRVFVTSGQAIITQLPDDFFNLNTPNKEADQNQYIAPTSEEQDKLLSTAESKLYNIGAQRQRITEGKSTLSGYVRNTVTGEPVIGAAVYIESPSIGVSTDALGFFTLTIPRGKYTLKVKSIGMRDTYRRIVLYGDGKLDIEMQESVTALKEVSITAGRDVNIAGTQMGQVKLNIKTMKQVPTAFGETDLLRTVLTLPGVKAVSESSVGLNVRGGSTDQNLILFNDAVVYNPSHLFGFFSAFNPDVIKEVELYKSTIPSKYGGRLSSVLEINSRDGNKKKFVGSGGIGLLTGRFAIEGPLVKEKSSFILAGRSTYSNWVLKKLENPSFSKSRASFYDLNLHINHEINEKNSVSLMGYLSQDQFRFFGDTAYSYRNQLASLKWKHTFNPKFYSVFTTAYSRYQYDIGSQRVPINAFDLKFDISQSTAKADFTYFLHRQHTLDFGVNAVYYKLYPGTLQPAHPESLLIPDIMESEQAAESAVYLEDRFDVNPRLSLTGGIRFSMFNYLGPKTVYTYTPGLPIEKIYTTGSQTYAAGKNIKNYQGPEYRVSARYLVNATTSLKVSYNTTRQYIHLLTNTMVMSPTDIWKLSDSYIKPQLGSQLALGVYRNLRGNRLELSVEAYYKNIQNFLDYKGGDSLILNHRVETAVISTTGKAYGIELMVKKLTGKLNGWVSYTYARSLLRANDRTSSDAPNKGNYYPSNYDKPHDFTMVSNYKFSHRFSLSLNFTYSSGRPYTPPIGKYVLEGVPRIYYAERNQFRIPDYYRMDFSINVEGNHKIKKLAHSSWTFAIFNVLGRQNPSSVYFRSQNGIVKGYMLSIFGQPIPTVTYNFRF
ncbi:TonB-dependent receptor [Runella slithyformis]|uniref:TonB-dependent receptor n=1 Tax=Runella slithyformis (strain ATCC 29530 / DSM 19594 / LMG 11500 / NCIMB 11436 / LSU 4) TaxID=761193 RepID=A0A7U3ZJD9_RUNSL|nr:TonB-dependent receptor [Runella slithyformis]AEI48332.1 TonB-dependent receptor [Runella slithyformis DSM 19594]